MFNPTNVLVDTNAIKQNIENIQKVIGDTVEIMPVVKGHAYGVGFAAVSKAIRNCRIAAVATVAEALSLRKFFAGEICLLYQPCLEDIPYILEYGFQFGTSNLEFVKRINELAQKDVKVHLNIETGSGMLGIKVEELEEFCHEIKALDHIKVEGIYMHYSCSEGETAEDIEFTENQSAKFLKAIEIAEHILGTIPYKHAGCSSATFTQPQTRFNMVRMGMIIYGYYPVPWIKDYVEIKPALKMTSKVIQVTEYPKDYYIGYGRRYKTNRPTKVATISGGYADGVHRGLFGTGEVLVKGQKCPIIGKVCMDLAMIDITDVKEEVHYDDEVILFDNEHITLHEFAKNSQTNVAECMLHIGQALNIKEVSYD